MKALVAHIMETGPAQGRAGQHHPAQDPQEVRLHGRRQAGVRGRLRAGGLGEPVHPVQVQGDGIRPGRADLDRRRRLARSSAKRRSPSPERDDVRRAASSSGRGRHRSHLFPQSAGRARFAQQRLTQAELLAFEPLGNVTLLHVTDVHGQLMPVLFPRAVEQSRRRRGEGAAAAHHRQGFPDALRHSGKIRRRLCADLGRFRGAGARATAASAGSTGWRPP